MTEPAATSPDHGVAIVGMSGRFPGARDLDELWRNLRDGVESITFFTPQELIAAGNDPERVRDPGYVPAKGSLAGVEEFDPAFFGFTPREAGILDPQHRVLLECAWEALEDAGYDAARLGGRAAVYVGSGAPSYLIHNLLPNAEELARIGRFQVFLLNDRDFVATRISYALGLRGPSVAVQTACSTSLMAVHMACQSLLSGESDLALAGGASIGVPLVEGYLYQEGSIASPDGHCRSYDARASGAVGGNGAGIVVLKRLADAVADGDLVHAVILGSAANNDGSGKVGFTAPGIEGQVEVIAESLLMAGVEPDTIAYVEGHGSATALGDPIEVMALRQAFARAGHSGRSCALGSVKSNLGHLNTAAGIAGLIKAVLALRHATIPPSLHFERPNPQVDFGPFQVPVRALPWPAELSPRRAGVSSFGLGGTNVHVVLESAPEREPSGPFRPWQLLLLSARTSEALAAQADRLADRLAADDAPSLADAAYTLQIGRKAFPRRRALVCRDAAGAVAALRAGRGAAGAFEGGSRPVVFLFPGLGDHYLDMGRELYQGEPVFAAEIDRCAEILRPHLGADLREILFSASSLGAPVAEPTAGAERRTDLRALLRRGGGARDEAALRLDRTEHAQPVLFAVEYALARLLMAWGIEPQACAGYSLGEYVAACLSGVLALEDALVLVARRARLIQRLPAGAMLAVPLAESEVRPLLGEIGEGLAVAATNGPHFCVVGGPEGAVAALASGLAARGVTCLRLATTHAFHTPMMEPAAAELNALARNLRLGAPRIRYLSNVTGGWIAAADLADPGYWARHMVRPVRFAENLAELLRDPDRVVVEVGPGGTLSALVRQHPDGGAGRIALTTLRRASEEGSDLALLLDTLGRLWVAGATIDAAGLFAGEQRRRVPLPTYPFERQRCWIDPPRGPRAPQDDAGAARERPAQPAALAREADLADWFWVPVWRQTVPLLPATDSDAESWLVFLDRLGAGERLVEELRGEGRSVVTVAAGAPFRAEKGAVTLDPARREDYEALVHHLAGRAGGVPTRIAHLWGLGEAPDFAVAQEAGLLSLVFLARAIATAGGAAGAGPAIRIAMAGDGLHEVLEGELVQPAKAAVLGACKVIHQESSRLTCFSLDAPPDERLAGRLRAELAREPIDAAVAYRGGRRWVRAFERISLPAAAESPLREGGVYLITDGGNAGGVGLAELLTGPLQSKVALLLPPAFPAPELWVGWQSGSGAGPGQEQTGAVVRRLLELTSSPGAADNLLIVRGGTAGAAGIDDIDGTPESDGARALRDALDAVRARFGPLDGAFHTPGSFTGGLLQLKTGEALAAALAPVEEGARALLAALAGEPLAFVVLMSSTLGFTGGLGQVDLAAAGSYLDALAQSLAAGPGRPCSVVAAHWDPYQWRGWLVGGLGAALHLESQQMDAAAIPVAASGEALRRLLASGLPRVIVSARDLGDLIAETDALTAESLMAQLAHLGGASPARPAGSLSRDGLSSLYVAPRGEREERLVALWEELFGVAPIGVDDSFLELGGHSLLAIQTATQVRLLFDADLPVTALFEAPTVAGLAKQVGRALGEESPEDLEALLALVEGLSADEAVRRLAAMGAPE
jgi:acyl transferase domain-containing protein